ncbi:DNA polymerase Y family protein [Acanthopleuribacter pedis]|uniref:UmuC domain-containing protein n=1 Tax=Acanthopleuribacter pedis TaxID=442870 RepID=A0A8J7U4M7_9BACT|nr:hypothetical protein [Acanthopleuribacter pedis]MBO1319603.1 hypothetical protein [Acanthopleuribacter pedis]
MTVFHVDIESFLTQIERLRDPALWARPLVIAPEHGRATVTAASPDAKQLGISKGMSLSYVQRTFPGVAVRVPDEPVYRRAHQQVSRLVQHFSPVVEPLGYGHFALDMSGMRAMYGNWDNAALKLNRRLKEALRLPATVGIAHNKLVSTIAAKEVQKAKEPLCAVALGEEPGFLAPLSSRALPEWEDKGVRKLLFELNLQNIERIQRLPRHLMGFAAGELGLRLHRHAFGVDPRPVTPPHDRNALCEEYCFQPDTNDDSVIKATLLQMVTRLCARLRAASAATSEARLALRFTDDVWRRRHIRFHPTRQEQGLQKALLRHYARWCDRRLRVRYLSLSCPAIRENHAQLPLFPEAGAEQVSPHLDQIRKRFGRHAIQRGGELFGQVG